MNKGLLIGIGIFLAVLVAGFLLLKNPVKTQPTSTPIPSATLSPDVSDSSPLKEFTVTETEFAFSPVTINVKLGDRVKITFVNSGFTEHDFIIDELDLKTEKTKSGATSTLEFTADKAGSFTYYCGISDHQEKGMEGTLTVTE